MAEAYRRFGDESFDDYFVRLFEHKVEYGLNCVRTAELLNAQPEVDEPFGECKWRKDYRIFNRGRMYERARHERGVETRILSISDLRVPFQKPVSVFSEYTSKSYIVQMKGDIVDFAGLSSFPKMFRSSPVEEMIKARKYLIDLIAMLRPKRVVVTYGNHDARFGTALAKALDNELIELTPETELDYIFNDGFYHYDKMAHTRAYYEPICEVFPDISIEYAGKWYAQIGQVIFCHPRAFKSAPMKTAQDAMMWFRNEGMVFSGLVMAHTHRLGNYAVGNTVLYEQGCCCETSKMSYANGRLTMSQKEGFLYLCLDKDGAPIRECSKLVSLN